MTYYTYSTIDPSLHRRIYLLKGGLWAEHQRAWTTDKRELNSASKVFKTASGAKFELNGILRLLPGWAYGDYRLEKIFSQGRIEDEQFSHRHT